MKYFEYIDVNYNLTISKGLRFWLDMKTNKNYSIVSNIAVLTVSTGRESQIVSNLSFTVLYKALTLWLPHPVRWYGYKDLLILSVWIMISSYIIHDYCFGYNDAFC